MILTVQRQRGGFRVSRISGLLRKLGQDNVAVAAVKCSPRGQTMEAFVLLG